MDGLTEAAKYLSPSEGNQDPSEKISRKAHISVEEAVLSAREELSEEDVECEESNEKWYLCSHNSNKSSNQYFFFSSFLDPRILPMLNVIMSERDYNRLKDDLIKLMVEKSKSLNKNINDLVSSSEPARKKRLSGGAKKTKDMFRGLSVKPASTIYKNDNQLSIDCIAQLNRYINDAQSGVCPLQDDDGNFNDPLKFWEKNQLKYEVVASLAHLYLPIPATSAPSERIWSRASRILSLRRARLKDDLVSRMMFVRENIKFLHKHYIDLVKEERDEHLHTLIHHELQYLPPLELEDDEKELDVGQDDHLLNF